MICWNFNVYSPTDPVCLSCHSYYLVFLSLLMLLKVLSNYFLKVL